MVRGGSARRPATSADRFTGRNEEVSFGQAYGVGVHPMAVVPILPKYSRPLDSITLVTGP